MIIVIVLWVKLLHLADAKFVRLISGQTLTKMVVNVGLIMKELLVFANLNALETKYIYKVNVALVKEDQTTMQ